MTFIILCSNSKVIVISRTKRYLNIQVTLHALGMKNIDTISKAAYSGNIRSECKWEDRSYGEKQISGSDG